MLKGAVIISGCAAGELSMWGYRMAVVLHPHGSLQDFPGVRRSLGGKSPQQAMNAVSHGKVPGIGKDNASHRCLSAGDLRDKIL
ncbi:hypothetical protein VTK56DRAFT_4149 [Thermocarpiscus australiensis]